jgi:Na+-driven multidrug efflux pump
VYIHALRGSGDTRVPMIFSIIGGLGLRIPIAFVGAILLGGGLLGAWCGMWVDNVSRCGLAYWRYNSGGWKKARV